MAVEDERRARSMVDASVAISALSDPFIEASLVPNEMRAVFMSACMALIEVSNALICLEVSSTCFCTASRISFL
jgi:hypothetical protein